MIIIIVFIVIEGTSTTFGLPKVVPKDHFWLPNMVPTGRPLLAQEDQFQRGPWGPLLATKTGPWDQSVIAAKSGPGGGNMARTIIRMTYELSHNVTKPISSTFKLHVSIHRHDDNNSMLTYLPTQLTLFGNISLREYTINNFYYFKNNFPS